MHSCNPNTWDGGKQQGDHEFEACLGYMVGSSLGYVVNSVCHLELPSETLFNKTKVTVTNYCYLESFYSIESKIKHRCRVFYILFIIIYLPGSFIKMCFNPTIVLSLFIYLNLSLSFLF